jgi:hypothetical protein
MKAIATKKIANISKLMDQLSLSGHFRNLWPSLQNYIKKKFFYAKAENLMPIVGVKMWVDNNRQHPLSVHANEDIGFRIMQMRLIITSRFPLYIVYIIYI